jgi:hypothetical protein
VLGQPDVERTVVDGSVERVEVVAHQLVKRRRLGAVALVAGGTDTGGFEILSVDPASFKVLDARVFVADLARSKAEARNGTDAELKWAQEYRFTEAYHKPDLSAESLKSLVQELRSDPRVREQFKRYNNGGGATPALSIVRWDTYSCSITEVDVESYGKCLCP